MVDILIIVVLILLGGGLFSFWRAGRQIFRLRTRLEEAWRRVEEGFAQRIKALEELRESLLAAGYVPEGQEKLRRAIEELRQVQKGGPEKLVLADERVEIVLREIYRALPRDRGEHVRRAQNALAQADEDLDIHKNHYNELVLAWYELRHRFPYRYMLRRFPTPTLLALPEEGTELARRHIPSF